MFANILFDAILIGILCVGVASGIKHGFVGTVAKPIKLLAAFSLAVSMAPTVGSSIIEPIIGPIITREISEVIREKYYSVNTSVTVGSLPNIIRILSVVSGVEIDSLPSGTESSSVIDNVVDTLTSPLVNVIGTVLGFIVVYFISKIFFKLFISFVDRIVKGGIMGTVNSALGCVLTLFLSFVVAWAVTSASEFVFSLPNVASAKWVEGFSGGPVYRFFRTFSPLDLLLSF